MKKIILSILAVFFAFISLFFLLISLFSFLDDGKDTVGRILFLVLSAIFSVPVLIFNKEIKRIQAKEEIKEVETKEELKYKLDESQNTINELSQKLKNENEVSESNQKSTLIESVKSFFGVNDSDSISLQSNSNTNQKEFKQELAESQNNFDITDILGNIIAEDIARTPHIIIADTIASYKSICTHSLITSIVYNETPNKARIILIDPKDVEFKVFEGIPHLLIPIVTETKKAAGALNWVVNEMEQRYNKFAEVGANDLKSYNKFAEYDEDILEIPQVFIFINELADIMSVVKKEVEDSICHIAQRGHTAGIHLIIAIQRQTTDINRVLNFIRPQPIVDIFESQTKSYNDNGFETGSDADYVIRAMEFAVNAGQLSTVMLQKKLKLGYARALRIMDELEKIGVIGSSEGAKPRKVLIDMEQYEKLVQEWLGHENSLSNLTHIENKTPEKKVIEYSDPLIPEAVEFAIRNKQLSVLMLQKRLKLGYTRASHIMKELKELNIISTNEESDVMITKEDYDNILFQQKSENLLNNMAYHEFMELPEYNVIKEYVSKLKIIDLKKFINELSPFDYNKTINVLSVLMADGTLTEYTKGNYIYAEYDAILSTIDNMSENGIEFERFTAGLLTNNGFTNVKLTQSSGDYGIDVIAEKDSVTYAIQCKCYSKPVGNKAVQEAYSGKDFYRCMVAVVFTNNYFTKSAVETAKQNNVILWDRNKLIELIKPLQINNNTNDELYRKHFTDLLTKMGNDIIANYSSYNILLEIEEIYLDDNGVLWELKVQNVDDIANIHLYIDELQEKLNAKVTLKEPLEYPKICIYVNYSEDLQNAHNNFKSI